MFDPSTFAPFARIFAYLDPGTGSIILQSVIAGVLGAVIAVKVFWRRIVAFFKGGSPVEGAEPVESKSAAEE